MKPAAGLLCKALLPRVLLLEVLLCAAVAAAACPLPEPALEKSGVQAVWKTHGEPIAVGRHFVIDIQLCPADAVLLRVDATMPAHRHGMNYRPSLQQRDDGRWRAQGLMFHMPGQWTLQLDVKVGAHTTRLQDEVDLP